MLISGLTVIAAMAGMFLSGDTDLHLLRGSGRCWWSAVAMLGSLTFLPAMMSLLGDRIEKGRIPFLSRRAALEAAARAWTAIVARASCADPAVAIVVAGGALLALTRPGVRHDT